ncbi:L-glutamate gamma-semialdehyde dehydrogenase [Candidatus Palauibacter sp.]|uniref:L-glutamate gamma-semialdehyde dehydrogenase n=1 Tax=Candidatus Palauibacter sp. TaxID=3101350 RepID=UPI003B5B8E83
MTMLSEEARQDPDRTRAGGDERPAGGIQGRFTIPAPSNEPVHDYAPGSPERAALKAELRRQTGQVVEIPLIIGGREVRTAKTFDVTMPHDHGHTLARCHVAGAAETQAAIAAAREAWAEWSNWAWEERAAILLRAAELLAGPWRMRLNAATMLGQSKTAMQAEIDSACEVVDFWRFNPFFAARVYGEQPVSGPGVWNRMDHRPLEGFVYAISPFNFTAIGANLTTSPALMGNVAIWKPSTTGVLSSYYVMKILESAGLPPGVINFIPGVASEVSAVLLSSPELGGIHFTGSTGTFQHLWKSVARNVENYRAYPRLVGETGGKDFILAHESADPQAVAVAIVCGGFEYQGQKCSAASRVYVPDTMWKEVRDHAVAMTEELRMGDPADFRNFLAAVIDRPAFDNIKSYIDYARDSADTRILAGGGCDDSRGYFIEPTLIQADDPEHKLMCEEIFGPVVTLHPYRASDWETTLDLVDKTSPYALTGAVFARDREAVRSAGAALRNAAGNYYINDKPSGAVVGQQPFGGGRASGTNDKAGSVLNLVRWVSPRTIKETFDPPTDYRYPFMEEE